VSVLRMWSHVGVALVTYPSKAMARGHREPAVYQVTSAAATAEASPPSHGFGDASAANLTTLGRGTDHGLAAFEWRGLDEHFCRAMLHVLTGVRKHVRAERNVLLLLLFSYICVHRQASLALCSIAHSFCDVA
jgi:hypothetical protein